MRLEFGSLGGMEAFLCNHYLKAELGKLFGGRAASLGYELSKGRIF